MKRALTACAIAAAVGCGGTLGGGIDAGDGGDAFALEAGPADDAGLTACTTPDGYRICGPATPCSSSQADPQCDQCFAGADGVGPCGPTLQQIGGRSCNDWCPDTELCSTYFFADAGGGNCIPFSLGVLFEKYSTDPSIVRYADFRSWTADPIPNPTTCPTIAGFQTCGGDCGGCPPGKFCSGRSSLHPVGACVSLDDDCWTQAPGDGYPATRGCPSGDSCFIFTVDPPSQPFANSNGGCMQSAQCESLAAELPGGGTCVDP